MALHSFSIDTTETHPHLVFITTPELPEKISWVSVSGGPVMVRVAPETPADVQGILDSIGYKLTDRIVFKMQEKHVWKLHSCYNRPMFKLATHVPGTCRCDIKMLLSTGHDPNCQEKK